MNNVYLINPSENDILENAGDRVPIGLMSIGTNLIKQGYDVKVFDLNHTIENDMFKEMRQDVPANVGISVYTSPMYGESVRLARRVRREIPYTTLIAGGYHATAMPKLMLEDFNAVVKGEGENIIFQALFNKGIFGEDRPDLNKLDNPNRKLLDMSKYGLNQSGKRTATLITSRGCPYHCAFCFNMSHNTRYEPVEKIKQQIDEIKEDGFDALYFLDDVFTLNEERMDEITRYAKDKGLPFRLTTRANLISESKIEKLAKNGCEWLSLGIESGNNEILRKSNKKMTTRDNYRAVAMADDHGIKTKGFFILGLPGETEETAKQTIDFALNLKREGLCSADFYFLTPFPGTDIWKSPAKYGIRINDRNFNNYLQAGKTAHCYIETEELSGLRIEELVKEAKERWKNST